MADERVGTHERREVAERAAFLCEYCKTPEAYAVRPFDIDHVWPSSREGSGSTDNLALACQGCNSYKHARTAGRDPVTGATVSLFNPRQDAWETHFTWSQDFTEILGLSPTGRVTVITLRLNRPGLVNLRRLLFGVGKHPPRAAEDAPQ